MDSSESGERLVRLETQVARLVSDAESEKDTRQRVNTEIKNRFDKLDATVQSIKDQLNRGKGFAIGILFAAGGMGAAVATVVDNLLGK